MTKPLEKFLEIVGSDGGDDNIIGSNILSNATSLHGLGGDDRLTSLNAEDKLYGGDGNDTYNVSSEKNSIIESANGGYDKIVSSTNNYSMELKDNIEELMFNLNNDVNEPILDIVATGNSIDNKITGSVGNDQIMGLAGNDTLYGMDAMII